jgi:hypothetical protein
VGSIFKGRGVINGAGDYGFMLTAIDGDVIHGGGVDKLRMKIWDRAANDMVVYDNQMGQEDHTYDGTALSGRSIAIYGSDDPNWATPSDAASLPTAFALSQNHPNPFNPMTTITLALPHATDYRLSVYDATGRLVRSFVGFAQPGEVTIVWDGTDGSGAHVSSGLYFYRAQAGAFTDTRRMVLLR